MFVLRGIENLHIPKILNNYPFQSKVFTLNSWAHIWHELQSFQDQTFIEFITDHHKTRFNEKKIHNDI